MQRAPFADPWLAALGGAGAVGFVLPVPTAAHFRQLRVLARVEFRVVAAPRVCCPPTRAVGVRTEKSNAD